MKQDAQKYEAMFNFVFVLSLFFLYISSNAKLQKAVLKVLDIFHVNHTSIYENEKSLPCFSLLFVCDETFSPFSSRI